MVACPVWLPDRPHLLPKEESHLARGAGWRWASAQLLMLNLTIAGTIELGKHAPSLRNNPWPLLARNASPVTEGLLLKLGVDRLCHQPTGHGRP